MELVADLMTKIEEEIINKIISMINSDTNCPTFLRHIISYLDPQSNWQHPDYLNDIEHDVNSFELEPKI